MNINIDEIFGDPSFNCRGFISGFDVENLQASIRDKGLLQPIVLQPITHEKYKYRVVMGHRRLKACQLLGHKTILAIVRDDLTEIQARTMNLVENLERKDLTIMQEARAIDKYVANGYDREEICNMLNKSSGWLQVRMAALKLPKDIQANIDEYNVSQEQIKAMATMVSSDDQYALMRDIIDKKIRGEKIITTPKVKKPNLNESKLRTVTEIFDLQDTIQSAVGNNLATRVLGWAAGEVSTKEVLSDLEQYANEKGLPYKVPA